MQPFLNVLNVGFQFLNCCLDFSSGMGGVLLTKSTNLCLPNLPPLLQRAKTTFFSFPFLPKVFKTLTESNVLQQFVIKKPVGLNLFPWRADQVYGDKVMISEASWTYVAVN